MAKKMGRNATGWTHGDRTWCNEPIQTEYVSGYWRACLHLDESGPVVLSQAHRHEADAIGELLQFLNKIVALAELLLK